MSKVIRRTLIRRSHGAGLFVAEPVRVPVCKGSHTPPRHGGRSESLNVGLVGLKSEVSGSFDFFHEPLFEAVRQSVADYGGHIYVMERDRDILDFAMDTGVDGILTTAMGRKKRFVLERLREADFPFVVMGGAYEDRSMPCVVVDNAGGIEAAVDHLVGLGHGQIAFVGLNIENPDHHERWNAFQRAIARSGIYVDPRLFLTGSLPSELDEVRKEISRWLDDGPPPFTAMLAASHLEGLAALRVLRAHGHELPADVSLVTFDDPPSAQRVSPALTAIRQPVEEIGRRSVKKLITAIRAGEIPCGTEVLPTQLIVRESTTEPGISALLRGEPARLDMPRWIGPCR